MFADVYADPKLGRVVVRYTKNRLTFGIDQLPYDTQLYVMNTTAGDWPYYKCAVTIETGGQPRFEISQVSQPPFYVAKWAKALSGIKSAVAGVVVVPK